MPIAHPMPTVATVKELYGTALVCGFDGCDEPLFKEKLGGQDRSLNSRVAHIAARSEGGPRWDPAMSEADNRSATNLILMCVRHADEIDQTRVAATVPDRSLAQMEGQAGSRIRCRTRRMATL